MCAGGTRGIIGPKAAEYVEHARDYILGRNPLDMDVVEADMVEGETLFEEA